MSFSASYDSLCKGVTAGAFILLMVVAIVSGSFLAAGLSAVILVAAYAWSPTGYAIEEGSLVVRRLIRDVRIPLAGIREVRQATAEDFRGGIRLIGSGGLFGYYGIYRTAALGNHRRYLTNEENAVVVRGDQGTAMVSPDDMDRFMAVVREGAKISPEGRASDAPAFELSASADLRTGWIGAVIAVAAVGFVVAAMLYSPGLPAYTLTAKSLTIHDRFYPVTLDASRINLAAARVIDLDADPEWKPVVRTNGFGNPRYQSGWFKTANGRTIRLYRAGGKRLVLLPSKGDQSTVLLETPAPGNFLAQVQHEWQPAM